MRKIFQINSQRIAVKLNSPDIVSQLDDTSKILSEIQHIIDDTNEQIQQTNWLKILRIKELYVNHRLQSLLPGA